MRNTAILLLLLPRLSFAGVVINEFVANPAGTDDGQEWVELYSDAEVVLDGYKLQRSTTGATWTTVFTFPASTTLAADGYFTVGDLGLAGTDFNSASLMALPNASSSGDALRIVDATDTLVDIVVYGPNNSDDIKNEDGQTSTFAPKPGDGDAIHRLPNGVDTDDSAADFEISDSPTPGTANKPPPVCEPDVGKVTINEFIADPSGADAGMEWVELYNADSSPIDIGQWKLEAGSTLLGGGSPFAFGSVIEPGGTILIASGAQAAPSATNVVIWSGLSIGQASTASNGLRLVDCEGTFVDTVIYGSPNTGGLPDDSGADAVSFAPKPVAGQSTARKQDGVDTDQSGADFVNTAAPTPDALNGDLGDADTDSDSDSDTDTDTDTDTMPAGPAHVVINELVPNPSGADGGNEWVELKNVSGGAVNLSGYKLQSSTNGTSWTDFHLFTSYNLADGERITVGDASVVGATILSSKSIAMGNASTTGDGVRLVAPGGTVVDIVVYGPNNNDGFVNELGATSTFAPTPGDGDAIGRSPDGVDSDDSGADFALFGTPSFGEENLVVITGCTDPVEGVVINELMPDPAGTDTDMEWVELYNGSGAAVDVSGWVIHSATSTFGTSGLAPLPAGTVIGAGAFLPVAQSALALPNAPGVVVADGFSLGNASSSADGVRLETCKGAVIDTVIYGAANSDFLADDSGSAAASLAPKPVQGQAIRRKADGVDTDQSGADFDSGTATPGIGNNVAPEDCGAPDSGVVINEFIPDPEGTDAGAEWVELYNAGDKTVDISGWAVEYGSSSFSSKFVITNGTMLPGDYFLIGGQNVPADLDGEFSLGNATSSSDALRLVDCTGYIADTVVYGTPNTDGFIDDTLQTTVSTAPKPASGASIARNTDGVDSDSCAADFRLDPAPTPGAANPSVAPPVCVASEGDVVINELLPDPSGSDDGLEWVELYNRGDKTIDLDGWAFSTATQGFGSIEATFPTGTEIKAGEFLVVGGDAVAEVDLILDFSLPNGSGGDGLRLYDCEGNRVDTAVYGDPDNPDGVLDDSDSAPTGLPDVKDGRSIGRVADGDDNDEIGDWASLSPSPGLTNVTDDDGTGGGDDEDPKGCGRRSSSGPRGGCSTTEGTGLAALLALALMRRRR